MKDTLFYKTSPSQEGNLKIFQLCLWWDIFYSEQEVLSTGLTPCIPTAPSYDPALPYSRSLTTLTCATHIPGVRFLTAHPWPAQAPQVC